MEGRNLDGRTWAAKGALSTRHAAARHAPLLHAGEPGHDISVRRHREQDRSPATANSGALTDATMGRGPSHAASAAAFAANRCVSARGTTTEAGVHQARASLAIFAANVRSGRIRLSLVAFHLPLRHDAANLRARAVVVANDRRQPTTVRATERGDVPRGSAARCSIDRRTCAARGRGFRRRRAHGRAAPSAAFSSAEWLGVLADDEAKRKLVLDCTGCHEIDALHVLKDGQPQRAAVGGRRRPHVGVRRRQHGLPRDRRRSSCRGNSALGQRRLLGGIPDACDSAPARQRCRHDYRLRHAACAGPAARRRSGFQRDGECGHQAAHIILRVRQRYLDVPAAAGAGGGASVFHTSCAMRQLPSGCRRYT